MRVWAVARLMIAEGVRMKIALVFLVLIGMVLLGLPFSIEGDSSVTGAVQSFLSYSLAATSVLLGFLTIFMSRSLSDELVQRQIFLVMTKPIPRWQFIVGKWVGMTVLNLVFLLCAGLTIYGMVHYIKRTHPPIDQKYDALELANEVLVARHSTKAKPPDFSKDAQLELETNLEQGMYANVPDFDPATEQARLMKKYEAQWRIVAPQDSRVFEFENLLVDRSTNSAGEIDKFIQVRYKAEVLDPPPDEVLRAVWRFGDPYKHTPVYEMPVRHVQGRYHTMRIPTKAVADDNTLLASFHNVNPFGEDEQFTTIVEFRASDPVEALFVVGSFEGNLFRLLILVLAKLMFLGAVALLMATVFSFPVACLASFTVYVLCGTSSFISEALTFTGKTPTGAGQTLFAMFSQGVSLVFKAIYWVIPDFSRYDAVEDFVSGRNVSLVWVLQGVSVLVVIWTVVLLGLAILLFQRREVAEVSF